MVQNKLRSKHRLKKSNPNKDSSETEKKREDQLIDEASKESFPASDPPGFNPSKQKD